MSQLFFLGASIVQGVGDLEGGWVDRLKRELHQSMYGPSQGGEKWGVFNLGISGNTSKMVLDRLPAEFMARKGRHQDFIFVLTAGTNDSKASGASTDYVSTPDEYETNLQKIIDFLKQHSTKIILVGLPPCDDAKTNPKGSSYFTLERIKLFDQSMTNVAVRNSLPKIEIMEEFLQRDFKALLFEDGLHPNGKGHELIANLVRPQLWKLLD